MSSRSTPRRSIRSALAAGIALSFALSGCAVSTNRSLESVHQPVVSHQSYTLDVAAGPGGLSTPEADRLAGWFEAMDLRYGDRIAIDDPLANEATRAGIASVASRFGMLISEDTPVTAGPVNPGTARVIITRAVATVPDCPNWHTKSDTNFLNGTGSNYGCAINSNIAAMVADPEHLIHGANGANGGAAFTSARAIDSYRSAKPTGDGGLKGESTSGK